MYAKKNSGMKVAATLLAIVLLISCAVGGTIAWLMDSTKEVTNTFTVGDINIDLTEAGTSAKNTPFTKDDFKIVPGATEEKDPEVTVKAGSEACYVFVKVTESNNETGTENLKYVTWEIADGWTELPGKTGVYYRSYNATGDETYSVLDGDQVTYSGELTKTQLETAATTKPSLAFTAYAVQMANGTQTFSPEEAWAIAQNNGQTPSNP